MRSILPTVERPCLELFVDLDVSPEKRTKYFGFDLDMVTITRGCTHGCAHCIVDARKLSPENIMPFPAVLKIAEQKKKFEGEAYSSWHQWSNDTAEARVEYRRIKSEKNPAETQAAKEKLRRTLEEKFTNHDIQQWLSTFGPVVARSPDFMRCVYLTFDGEPSDYRDETYLHDDGTPANWGDVFVALSTPLRPVSFSTAGWPISDHIANTGADTIAAALRQNKRLKDILAISISPYDKYYRIDPESYRQAMERVIRIFGEFHPTLLVRSEQGKKNFEDFFNKVYVPLVYMYLEEFVHTDSDVAAMQKSLLETQVRFGKTSHYGGRAFLPGHEDDPDILIDSAGVHLWPDGRVAIKKHNSAVKIFNPGRGIKGDRPQATQKKLF